MFIKLGRNMQSKEEVLSFGFGLAVLVLAHLLAVLLIDGFFLRHSVVYGAHKQTHNK